MRKKTVSYDSITIFLAAGSFIWYTFTTRKTHNGDKRMGEEEKNSDLEDLFKTFDKQFAECEQKFTEIEENLKAFRAEQDQQNEPEPEKSE